MNYLDNKEKFYQSEYAMQIVDKWVTGIPFFMEDENGVYDAFLFYSDNRKTSHFYGVKMLIATNVSTGEIKCLSLKLIAIRLRRCHIITIGIDVRNLLFYYMQRHLLISNLNQLIYIKKIVKNYTIIV